MAIPSIEPIVNALSFLSIFARDGSCCAMNPEWADPVPVQLEGGTKGISRDKIARWIKRPDNRGGVRRTQQQKRLPTFLF
jgi:hypothetical protein